MKILTRWLTRILIALTVLTSYSHGANAKPKPEDLVLQDNIQPQEYELVVLLHGIFRSKNSMNKLERHFQEKSYRTLNIDYPSTKLSLTELADDVYLQNKDVIEQASKVHFVGYSMGGLVVRVLINKHQPKNLGQVVLLATPNHGSEVADFLKNNFLYKWLYGPAGQQLITDQTKIKNHLGETNYNLGVLAGNQSIDPLSSLLIKGPNDGKVSIKSTYVKGMNDHMVIKANHTFFPSNKEVIYQTAFFIKQGEFHHGFNP